MIRTIAVLFSSLVLGGCGVIMNSYIPPAEITQEVWVGSRVKASDDGVRVFRFDPKDNSLTEKAKLTGIENPTWIARVDDDHVAVVSETSRIGARREGEIVVLGFDGERLSEVERRPSGGNGPCHVTKLRESRSIAVAHYGDGTAAVHELDRDLRFVGEVDLYEPVDLGPLRRADEPNVHPRQSSPRAHEAVSATFGSLLVTDLGRDRIYLVRRDREGRLRHQDPAPIELRVAPGSGPRHIHLDESRGRLIVVGEISSTVEVFTFDSYRLEDLFAPSAATTPRRIVSTLPADRDGSKNHPSAITGPIGQDFYYVANRGDNSIALIEIEKDGTPRLIETFPCGGQTPWDIRLSAGGTILFVANYGSNDITLLPVDRATGRLGEPILRQPITKPTCVVPFPGPHRDPRDRSDR